LIQDLSSVGGAALETISVKNYRNILHRYFDFHICVPSDRLWRLAPKLLHQLPMSCTISSLFVTP